MSTQVSSFRAYLGNEELLKERQNSFAKGKAKEKSRKTAIESSHNKYFTDGVRAPLLSDITSGQSCRLDVVRPHKTDHSVGSVSPDAAGKKPIIPQIPYEKENSTISYSERTSNSVRSMKFLLANGTFRSQDELEATSRSASDLDVRWKGSSSKKVDARDILYRNTYCNANKKLRYHTMTLPNISGQNTAIPRVPKSKTAMNMLKKKQSPRQDVSQPMKIDNYKATPNKSVSSKNSNSVTDEGFLKVQKIKCQVNYLPDEKLFTSVKQPTDVYQNTSYPVELRTERPLKYETVGPYGSRINRKHSSIRTMLPYFVRDHRSADAYQNYLNAVKSRMELNGYVTSRMDRDSNLLHIGEDNRMLQSVIDVNTPREPHGTLSHDSKSLVIEIKPTWNEIPNGLPEDVESEVEISIHKCPVNTPAHD